IKVAIAGIGNCASALLQGTYYYRDGREEKLVFPSIGGYKPKDIEFVAAFDIAETKVGKDLSEAIFGFPNNTIRFQEVPELGIKVKRAPIYDGLGKYLKEVIKVSEEPEVDITTELKESEADILINYLPVGSEYGSRQYAEAALNAGCGFINAMPAFIASDDGWSQKFEQKKIPLAGDDVMSQIGATVLHKTIAKLLVDRGVEIEETYQLNVGGDTDFLNMLEEERLKSKRISKTSAVEALIPYKTKIRIGPSDYIEFLNNRKICYIWMKGRYFGGTPVTIDVKLAVVDAPNSAGVMIDAVRGMKLAWDRGIGGALYSLSAYCFKHPPQQMPYHIAKEMFRRFIEGEIDR
ncbi:MAG TPA: inositol-3-phosphate synthase, partial [Candidatus Bathyarchaeota archaeon]|nr:inositol-3-phosphate synthase [Candidatus Bathyarchaeota archaeon]